MSDATDRGVPLSLPLDLRRGLTDAGDTAFPLRWGILGAGRISTDQVPSLYATANLPLPVQVFEYPLPGTFSMQRPHPNQHGFLYQAEAVHRCLAAGLRECPQYGRQESLHAMDLLTSINSLLREQDD